MSVEYKEFLQIKPFYHELCQSDFVSDEWINHLFTLYEQSWKNSIQSDFRRIGAFQFQTIRSLCQLAKTNLEENLQSFQLTQFVQSQLVSQELFQAEMHSFIADFVDLTPKTFVRTLRFIQNVTAQSLLMTGASITSVLPYSSSNAFTDLDMLYAGISYTFSDGFSCICSSSTATTCMGITTFKNEIVSGFQTGCFMLSALLQSTLEAFYNQSFVDLFTNSSSIFYKLNSSNSKWTIEMMINQMFVVHWSNTTSYENYFKNCAPDLCQYTTIQYYSLLHTVTLLIGLFGGLSSLLQFITPITIVYIWPILWKLIDQRQRRRAQSEQTEAVSICTQLMRLFQLIKRSLIELNLFKNVPPSQDEQFLRQERRITKFYLILFFICLLILILFTSIGPQTISVTVQSPSSTTYIQLSTQHPFTLTCPCSQNTIKYKQFISDIKPQYHEICLSQFVSSEWINVNFSMPAWLGPRMKDFRSQSQFYFQLLSTLCHMANQTIDESLQSFYLTELFTSDVLSPELFDTQINFLVAQFQRTLPELFQMIIQLTKANFKMNQFITSMNSVFSPGNYIPGEQQHLYVNIQQYIPSWLNESDCISNPNARCQCYSISTDDCYDNIKLYGDFIDYTVPGMFLSWTPFESLLLSTLECFYREECFSHIRQVIDPTSSKSNFTILTSPSSNQSKEQYDSIEYLANTLFIRSWNFTKSYQSYFDQCHPLECQYTYETRSNLIYIITTLFGLIGGLNIVLRLLSPIMVELLTKIVKSIFRQQQNVTVTVVKSVSTRLNNKNRFQSFLTRVKKYMIELDLFRSIPPSQDPKVIRIDRRKTRVYLILLITALLILILYASTRQNTTTVIVKSPSVSQYNKLFAQYSSTLECPCSHTAVQYEKFISEIEPQYHQICSSVFVTSEWIESSVVQYPFKSFLEDDDFRVTLGLQFRMISILCTLSQKTLNLALSLFNQTGFFTSHVISVAEFHVRTQALIEEKKRVRINQLTQTLKLIQLTNVANQLATSISSNWEFFLKYSINPSLWALDSFEPLDVLAQPKVYDPDNCSCAAQSNCSKFSIYPFPISNQSLIQTIPGFRIGCQALDALLLSTLSCLYDETCVDLMRAAIFYSKPVPFELLTSYSSSMPPNTTIQIILDQLFVSEWFYQTSFDHYFNECAPQQCQYSYSMNFDQIYVVTTLFALFGGLTRGLHIMVSCTTLLITKLFNCRKKKNTITLTRQQVSIPTANQDNFTTEMPCFIINSNQLPTASVQQDIERTEKRRERVLLVGLCLLAASAIIIVSIVWIWGENEKQKFILTTAQTTAVTSSSLIETITTTTTTTCYMTLKYQSQTYSTGRHPKSFTTGDFNRDLVVDLAVTNYDDDTLSMLLGNGDGTFQKQQIYSTGSGTHPWGITTADFNNDTFLDLAVTLFGTNSVAMFFGIIGNVSFSWPPYQFPFDTFHNAPTVIEIIDADGNGLMDLAVGSQLNRSNNLDSGNEEGLTWILQRVNSCNIFVNLGNGHHFKNLYSMSSGIPFDIIAIAVGDFDNDGKQNDLSFCDSIGSVSIFCLTNLSAGLNYTNSDSYLMHEYPSSMIKGRFNDDELDDLALVSSQSDTLQILLGYGDGSFVQQIYLTNSHPTSVARINLNNDMIDDLVILHCNRTVNVFFGTKPGLFDRHPVTVYIDDENNDECAESLKVADLNQDGKDDLVFIDTGANSIRVLLGASCNE